MSIFRAVGIVTGGAAGIGLGIVRHLAGEGMALIAADVDAAACAAARNALTPFAEQVRVIEADIGTPAGAARAIDEAIEAFGRLDLLCNNAARHPLESIEDHSLENWREAFRVNVEGALLCCQRALPHMKARQSGTVVNIGSTSGVMPYAAGGAYAASKAALAMLTRVLALEVGPYGITVNCICPGTIRHRAGDDKKARPGSRIPIGRYGSPTDVAGMVSYLTSPAAGYMTGSVIVLDGGATAGRQR